MTVQKENLLTMMVVLVGFFFAGHGYDCSSKWLIHYASTAFLEKFPETVPSPVAGHVPNLIGILYSHAGSTLHPLHPESERQACSLQISLHT